MTLVLEYSLLFPWPQEAHLRHFLISSSPFSVNIYWALSLYQTPRSSRVTTEKRNQGRNRLLNWREFSLQSSMPLWPNCSYGTYISLYEAVISSCVVFPMWLLVLPRQRTQLIYFIFQLSSIGVSKLWSVGQMSPPAYFSSGLWATSSVDSISYLKKIKRIFHNTWKWKLYEI